MALCEAIDRKANEIAEVAPPGKKAERFIKKHKKEFKKNYGKKWASYLYGTAWKQFGEGATFRNYLSMLDEDMPPTPGSTTPGSPAPGSTAPAQGASTVQGEYSVKQGDGQSISFNAASSTEAMATARTFQNADMSSLQKMTPNGGQTV
jgi:hypothetical protein